MSRIFVVAIAVSAFLLFWVQFMVGKLLLPVLGGTPAVWNTCMVFFQVMLLAGYGYAHAVTYWLKPRAQVWLTVGLLVTGMICVPLSPPVVELSQATNAPVGWLLTYLLSRVGLPLLGLSALAPLLQVWFRDCFGTSPYWLYGASNAASLTSLLLYPTLIEVTLPLTQQINLWAVGYGVLVALVMGCGYYRWQITQHSAIESSTVANSVNHSIDDAIELESSSQIKLNNNLNSQTNSTRQPWLSWLILAAIPSSLLLGVTTHITTDITPMPLLWALPLTVYLLSWVLVFSERFLPVVLQILTPLVLIGLMLTATFGFLPTLWLVAAQILGFGWVCWALHGRLATLRPKATDLTKFYLMIALGGALGGSLNSLFAPMWFRTLIEYPLILGLAVLWLPIPTAKSNQDNSYRNGMLFQIGLTLSVLSLVLNAPINGTLIAQGRSFFGTYRITEDGGRRIFAHGTTIHGVQYQHPDQQREPLSYFSASSPISLLINTMQPQPKRVGVVGLGIGTLATYGQAGQNWTFYEIDPLVANFAQNYFTYLSQSRAKVNLVIGDGRLALAALQPKTITDSPTPEIPYDLLILDAFSSDAVPTHLLTKEALQIYLKKLSSQGVIAYNVTNRYLDLAPILANLAQDSGLKITFCQDQKLAATQEKQGNIFPSKWVIMARDVAQIQLVLASDSCRIPTAAPVGWSDDFSNVLPQVRWQS
jgi:hypothetical protein